MLYMGVLSLYYDVFLNVQLSSVQTQFMLSSKLFLHVAFHVPFSVHQKCYQFTSICLLVFAYIYKKYSCNDE